MQSLRLRAITRAGEPYLFEPADVPVCIWEDAFILARRPGSPILRTDSVVRVMDDRDVGEGDIVQIDHQEYTVGYFQGFYYEGIDGSRTSSNLVSQCRVFSVGTRSRSRIQFKSSKCAFQMLAFMGWYGNKIITAHDPAPFVPEELQMSVGLGYLGQKLYYGDLVDGKPVLMWHGRPCILTDEGYLELPSHKIIGKES